jgi:hypothetical protein
VAYSLKSVSEWVRPPRRPGRPALAVCVGVMAVLAAQGGDDLKHLEEAFDGINTLSHW